MWSILFARCVMSVALKLSNIGLPIGSLDAYIHQVNQIPMLSAED